MSTEASTIGDDRSVQELRRGLTEAQEQQAATAEILAAISSSPTDPRGVFEKIAVSAARLCDADDAAIRQVEGDHLRLLAHHGPIHAGDMLPLTRGLIGPRAVLDRRTIHIIDALADGREYGENRDYDRDYALRTGIRTMLAIPLIRAGEATGVINIRRTEVRPFSDRQIELLKIFADQAVIAIENARLFEAEQARTQELTERTQELTEALQYQTATSDVLGVIAASATDIRPVLRTLVESACLVCTAYDGIILLREGDWLQVKAHHGPIPASVTKRKITRDWVSGRCVTDRVQIHVRDLQAEVAEYPEGAALAQRLGARTILSTPLMREGEAIGAIMIRRDEVCPFNERQIKLLNTFADQAVIAIENTRLFEAEQTSKRELQESLEYQTATSEVLNVISRSPTELQPVLESIAATVARLCGSVDAQVYRIVDERIAMVAQHGSLPRPQPGFSGLPVTNGTVTGRAVIERRTIHVHDLAAVLDSEYPDAKVAQKIVGHRTTLATPLLSQGEPLGAILLRRMEVRPFSQRQIELLQTFADQAVIAIENTRLFEEIARKSRELEIASQHKSQFVANMSHELRTPLAAMLGYAELLQEGIYGAPPEKFMPILARIHTNGKHLLGLINTVLDISKIEAGQFKLNLGEYALDSIVETVMVATESLAATKKLAFKTEVAKGLPYGLGDEQRLTQVLLNLVGNAIKFTDAGEVRIAAVAVNGHFEVSVSDTGPGIPPEECERIFEKFRQVDSSNTRAKGGTGLGLAIAREIVEMHGGRIWAESTLGKGSTFRMKLPVRAAASAGAT